MPRELVQKNDQGNGRLRTLTPILQQPSLSLEQQAFKLRLDGTIGGGLRLGAFGRKPLCVVQCLEIPLEPEIQDLQTSVARGIQDEKRAGIGEARTATGNQPISERCWHHGDNLVWNGVGQGRQPQLKQNGRSASSHLVRQRNVACDGDTKAIKKNPFSTARTKAQREEGRGTDCVHVAQLVSSAMPFDLLSLIEVVCFNICVFTWQPLDL